MKKNKIIIPAMAMILFSTAASISGTVAWFTASRVFQTQVGQFNVVETEGNLDVKMIPISVAGTVKGAADNSIKVIDNIITPTATYTQGTALPDPVVVGDYFYKTDDNEGAGKMYIGKAGDPDNWGEASMTVGDYYRLQDGFAYKAKSATVLDLDSGRSLKPAILTHGSVDLDSKKAYIIDSDDTSTYLDRGLPEGGKWLYEKDVTVKDRGGASQTIDIYVAVAWKMKFTYTFASDRSSVGIYLDRAKSKINVPDVKTLDFTKAADGKLEDTARGFRISFSDGGHNLVWGNNKPLMSVPTTYSAGVKAAKSIVRKGGVVYQAKDETSADWDESDWDKLMDLPDYSNTGKYAIGDLVAHEGKVYECKTAIQNTSWGDADWVANNMIDRTIPDDYSPSAPSYNVGDIVLHEGKIYKCSNSTSGEFDSEKWQGTGDITLDWAKSCDATYVAGTNVYPEWESGTTYAVGNIIVHNSTRYRCVAGNSDTVWTPGNWAVYTGATPKYDSKDYVTSTSGAYARLSNKDEAAATVGVAERIAVIPAPIDPAVNTAEVTVTCSAWFEGTDPNVISGAAMACLGADMTLYARTLS